MFHLNNTDMLNKKLKTKSIRAVQSLWTAGKPLAENAHGWLNPQAQLMSWALSARTLCRNFEEVALYTDSEGARVLVDQLKLPYTEVHVCYDNLRCHPLHWAYSKILAYSKQDAPFVHVDGDLYLPHGLSDTCLRGELIAQNEEEGSMYYKGMMSRIVERGLKAPAYLMEELGKDGIGSYNAGVLGGNDVEFIHSYCEEAARIIKDNGWDNPECPCPDMNNNLLFEQILFYVMARNCGRKVETIIEGVLGDNKYSYTSICDMVHFEGRDVLHLLGGHKRNPYACGMMEKVLLSKYPEDYMRVISLFEKDNCRVQSKCPQVNVARYLAEYENYVNDKVDKWSGITNSELVEADREACSYMTFYNCDAETRNHLEICCRQRLQVYEFPEYWPNEAKDIVKRRLDDASAYRFSSVALYPTVSGRGYREVLLNDLQYNIVELAREAPVSYETLVDGARSWISADITQREDVKDIVNRELDYLYAKGILCVR